MVIMPIPDRDARVERTRAIYMMSCPMWMIFHLPKARNDKNVTSNSSAVCENRNGTQVGQPNSDGIHETNGISTPQYVMRSMMKQTPAVYTNALRENSSMEAFLAAQAK